MSGVDEDTEKQSASCTAFMSWSWPTFWQHFVELRLCVSYTTSGMRARENRPHIHKEACVRTFIAAYLRSTELEESVTGRERRTQAKEFHASESEQMHIIQRNLKHSHETLIIFQTAWLSKDVNETHQHGCHCCGGVAWKRRMQRRKPVRKKKSSTRGKVVPWL